MTTDIHRRQRGQVLALFAFGALVLVGMVAFVVDGGNAWAQQRITQNGTDAASLAGTTVVARVLGGEALTDSDVEDEVQATAAAMEIVVDDAQYTNIDGDPIGTTVGSIGSSRPPVDAAGVAVTAHRDFGTYFARALGMDQMTAVTHATAITGYGQPYGTGVLPVTPPVNVVTCDGQNDPVFDLDPVTGQPYWWSTNKLYRVPLCKNGPGNVGWIDWTPPSGGTNELADAIIPPPYGPPIALPSWNFVTQTGNTNSGQVEDALRYWDGKHVLIPLFDSTCNTQPLGNLVTDCPPPNVGGNGQNQWYHFPVIAVFKMCITGDTDSSVPPQTCTDHGAYIQGNNRSVCDTGNGATSCLVGQFVNMITEGTVTGPLSGTPVGPSRFVVVQLIK
jgi:Flp pilus assembly protein TadG